MPIGDVLAAALRPVAPDARQGSPRRVLMFGAAGTLGETVLIGLLADPCVASVHIVTTAPLPSSHAKLHFIGREQRASAALSGVCSAVVVLGQPDGVQFAASCYGRDKVFAALEESQLLECCYDLHQRDIDRLVLVAPTAAHLQSDIFDRLLAGDVELQLVRWFTYLTVIRPGRPMVQAGARSLVQRAVAGYLAQLSMMIPAHRLMADAHQVARLVAGALHRNAAGVEVFDSLAASTPGLKQADVTIKAAHA